MSVITTATGAVSAPIAVGEAPVSVAITPDGKHAYVTNEGKNSAGNTVSVITTATGAVSPITVVGGPDAVAFTPDGKRAYVTNSVDGTVSVITTATGAVSAPITVGKVPYAVAICPTGVPTDPDCARGSTDAHAGGPARQCPGSADCPNRRVMASADRRYGAAVVAVVTRRWLRQGVRCPTAQGHHFDPRSSVESGRCGRRGRQLPIRNARRARRPPRA